MVLYGFDTETAEVDRLLARAHDGQSGVLVLHGLAGSGKTALLQYAADAQADIPTLRCTGLESEAELPFAALHQLLHAHRERIDVLPGPQAAAMRVVFGLADGPAAGPFLIGLATLTMLSDIAADGPVLCLVDDAQWIDRASLDALLFAGRRSDAEGIAFVIAHRDQDTGLPAQLSRTGTHRRLPRLNERDAAALLAERVGHLPSAVRQRLIEEADGNPLALIELAAALGRSGEMEPPPTKPMPVGANRVAREFGRQVAWLPARSRTALLVAAAEGTGELSVVLAAAARLGIDLTDLAPAEQAGLVRCGDATVTFRHPLVRSVTYERACYQERIAVHRALAAVLHSDADRRAWHLAAGTVGTDEEVASQLKAAAVRAELRGGYAASTAAYRRAARLTTDPERRGRWLAAAASAAGDSGQLSLASDLAIEAEHLASDPALLAKLRWVRARIEYEHGSARRAYDMLLDAAPVSGDPELAACMLAEAVRMAYFADCHEGIARALPAIEGLTLPAGHPLRPLLEGAAISARLLSGTPPEDLPPLPQTVNELRPGDLGERISSPNVQAAFLIMAAGRAEEALNETERLLFAAREQGLVADLPHLLIINAEANLVIGRLRAALAACTDGLSIAEDTGQHHSATYLRSVLASVLAMTGDEERCAAMAKAVTEDTLQHSASANVAAATLALCTLDLGYGRYAQALRRFEQLSESVLQHPATRIRAAPVWIEAAARAGRPASGDRILAQYETWINRHQDRTLAYAIAHRCRALLASDDEAEKHFDAALCLHQDIDRPLARARTELLYGEWLRRTRRRVEARGPLTSALRAFADAGAQVWEQRARTELRAAGDTTTNTAPEADVLDRLTPQELAVVRLAATGLSNRDIAARLFLSPRTVGYHLYKAYPKLGVSTRIELTRLHMLKLKE